MNQAEVSAKEMQEDQIKGCPGRKNASVGGKQKLSTAT